jgi:hypothetical protein
MTATELADELRPMCDLAHAIAPCDRCGWPVITGKTSTPDCRMTFKCPGKHRPPKSRKDK